VGPENKIVSDYVKELHTCLDELSRQDIEEIAGTIFDAYKKGKQIFVLGNGGSATTACHFARDLQIGTAAVGKPRIRTTCLTDNIALVTSLANDIDYGSVFKEQLIGQLTEGDIVIGITGSGNSDNVLKAMEFARSQGAIIVGLIGFGGGKLKELAHKHIVLSSKDYGPVEDIHLVLSHIITYLVREKLNND
jgi:D-sedoheptulose 7-phosphate isomerase